MCNIGEGRLGWLISTVGVGAGGEPRRASITSTGCARGCSWLGRGRHEAPGHVRPNGRGGVSDAPDGKWGRTAGEGVSGAGD